VIQKFIAYLPLYPMDITISQDNFIVNYIMYIHTHVLNVMLQMSILNSLFTKCQRVKLRDYTVQRIK
jgi:hypothetical protein